MKPVWLLILHRPFAKVLKGQLAKASIRGRYKHISIVAAEDTMDDWSFFFEAWLDKLLLSSSTIN
ncbi:MAG: hypothetical protein KGV46_01785 [Pasteurella sp.]|nr:hypothetical protein [Pasteurella sp.]